MTYLAPILIVFSLVCLTAPDGNPVWVTREAVISVGNAADCAKGSNAKIGLNQGTLCVQETPQQVLKKLEEK